MAAYPTVRAGLRVILAADSALEIVGEAATLDDLLAEQPPRIDVLVIDVDATASQLGAGTDDLSPDTGVVVIGPDAAFPNLASVMGERAWAYLLREAGAPEISAAVHAVAAGLIVLQPPLFQNLVAVPPLSIVDTAQEPLTAREHEVLQLVAQGLPNKTIAARLGISEHTIKFHVTSILSKLGAASRTEAVRLGARRGLIVL